MSEIEDLLQRGRDSLARLRIDRGEWDAFRAPSDGGESVEDDPAELPRLEVAWALQYDWTQNDRDIVRFLFQEEVQWRELASFQGVGESLEILGWLMARDRRVDDVWLFARAKAANFDTSCGFDREHLFAAGVEQTLVHVRMSQRPERDEVLEEMLGETGDPIFGDDEIAAWLSAQERSHVCDPYEEPTVVWLGRALAAANTSVARRLLDAWAREGDNAGTPGHVYYLVEVEAYDEAARIQRKIANETADPFQRAGAFRSLAALERKAGDLEGAVRALRVAAAMHREEPRWREYGLARMLVSECFETALACTEERAREAFRLGDELGRVTPRLPLVGLEIAVRAAQWVGDVAAEARYEHLRIAEEAQVRMLTSRQ